MIHRTAISQNTFPNASILKQYFTLGLISGLIAVGINGFLYFIALNAQGGLFIQVGQGPESISLASILAFSFFPSIFAAGLYFALVRFSKFPIVIFLSFALMVFTGFFFGPLNAASNTFTLWTLELMHGVAAIPIILFVLNARINSTTKVN